MDCAAAPGASGASGWHLRGGEPCPVTGVSIPLPVFSALAKSKLLAPPPGPAPARAPALLFAASGARRASYVEIQVLAAALHSKRGAFRGGPSPASVSPVLVRLSNRVGEEEARSLAAAARSGLLRDVWLDLNTFGMANDEVSAEQTDFPSRRTLDVISAFAPLVTEARAAWLPTALRGCFSCLDSCCNDE